MAELKQYYWLVKPGIVYGNALTVTGGFLLASQGHPQLGLFIFTLVGISLIIASSCVFNNYIDRGIDARMDRTRDRALVKGTISNRAALTFGIYLGVFGFGILGFYTNVLTTIIAAIGFFFYIFMYSMWFKRRSEYGTHVGSVAGAVPPLVGYCAASGRFDGGALLLFLTLVFWQMPHFFSIAIYRLKEYAAASIPVWPLKKGIQSTKINIAVYIVGFIFAAGALAVFGYTGYVYLSVMLAVGLAWLAFCIRGFWNAGAADDVRWARRMFFFSLAVIVVFSIMISLRI